MLAKKFKVFIHEFGMGLPPRVFGRKKGETLYSINALPFGGFVKMAGENGEESDPADKEIPSDRLFNHIAIWKRTLIIIGGVFMNFIFGWFLIAIVFMAGTPKAVFISEVADNSPAQQIGLKPNDKVVGYESVKSLTDFIEQNKGKEITLSIQRGDEIKELKATPRENPPQGQGPLGVALIEGGQEKQPFFSSIWESLKVSWDMFTLIYKSIFGLIKSAIIGEADLGSIGGPVKIVQVSAQTSELGIIYFIQLMALISINLAALNIFPFPALDGGRILFLIIEKIKGSPLPRVFEQYANVVGLGLLLLLILLVTIKDIKDIFW